MVNGAIDNTSDARSLLMPESASGPVELIDSTEQEAMTGF